MNAPNHLFSSLSKNTALVYLFVYGVYMPTCRCVHDYVIVHACMRVHDPIYGEQRSCQTS